jgi:hypothetical protein
LPIRETDSVESRFRFCRSRRKGIPILPMMAPIAWKGNGVPTIRSREGMEHGTEGRGDDAGKRGLSGGGGGGVLLRGFSTGVPVAAAGAAALQVPSDAAHSLGHTAGLDHHACNGQHATCNMRHATCNMRNMHKKCTSTASATPATRGNHERPKRGRRDVARCTLSLHSAAADAPAGVESAKKPGAERTSSPPTQMALAKDRPNTLTPTPTQVRRSVPPDSP